MLALTENRHELIDSLRQQVRWLEKSRPQSSASCVSTGARALDSLLPSGGLERGSLTEWLTAGVGNGATMLSFLAARQATSDEGLLLVSDRHRQFFPLAAANLGIDPKRILVMRCTSDAEEVWAIDQALRCKGVAAVWARLDRIREQDFRRLQLAAETGGSLGLFVRPARARSQPSWSQVQFLVRPVESQKHRRLQVEVLKVRHAQPGGSVTLEIDDVTGAVRDVKPFHSREAAAQPRLFA